MSKIVFDFVRLRQISINYQLLQQLVIEFKIDCLIKMGVLQFFKKRNNNNTNYNNIKAKATTTTLYLIAYMKIASWSPKNMNCYQQCFKDIPFRAKNVFEIKNETCLLRWNVQIIWISSTENDSYNFRIDFETSSHALLSSINVNGVQHICPQ